MTKQNLSFRELYRQDVGSAVCLEQVLAAEIDHVLSALASFLPSHIVTNHERPRHRAAVKLLQQELPCPIDIISCDTLLDDRVNTPTVVGTIKRVAKLEKGWPRAA